MHYCSNFYASQYVGAHVQCRVCERYNVPIDSGINIRAYAA